MGFIFKSKEEKAEIKRKEQEAIENAKREKEIDAAYATRTQLKELEKNLRKLEDEEEKNIKLAAEAKLKGNTAGFNLHINAIKICRARKAQVEGFKSQVEYMQTIKNISGCSQSLLASMNEIARTLGAITIDKSAMVDMQKTLAKTQEQIDRQGMLLEELTDTMTFDMDNIDVSDVKSGMEGNDQLIAEIEEYTRKKIANSQMDTSELENQFKLS